MDPGDTAIDRFVFDTVSGRSVVLHDFSCADTALDIDLVVDRIAGFARSEAVVRDYLAHDGLGKDGQQEGNERAGGREADGGSNGRKRNRADVVFALSRNRHHLTSLSHLTLHRQPQRRRLMGLEIAVHRSLPVLIVGRWILDIATRVFVITAPVFLADFFALSVNVG